MQPRHEPSAVFVGKTRIPSPPGEDIDKELEIISQHLRPIVVNIGRPGLRRQGSAVQLLLPALRPAFLGGVFFYAVSPLVALGWAAGRHARAVVCKSPYEAVGVLALRGLLPRRARPAVEIQLHGDWTTAWTMYGSPARRLVGPWADRVAQWALRRADRVRVVSTVLEERVREAGYQGPVDRYLTFSNFGVFLDQPLLPVPSESKVAFVGVLEPYKAVDVLLDSWKAVASRVPDAQLTIVGAGPQEAELRNQARGLGLDGTVRFVGHLQRAEVRAVIDDSSCLVLPSRSEGLPRIVMEAMARGRAVVASTVGGMAEFIEDGRNGRLVPPEDPVALAEALIGVLSDPTSKRAMGDEARRRAVERSPMQEYEAGIARLASWISAT
jgi:glycosyltransferase involved in cell wall biosynthesis